MEGGDEDSGDGSVCAGLSCFESFTGFPTHLCQSATGRVNQALPTRKHNTSLAYRMNRRRTIARVVTHLQTH
jgi:hypothetical protein